MIYKDIMLCDIDTRLDYSVGVPYNISMLHRLVLINRKWFYSTNTRTNVGISCGVVKELDDKKMRAKSELIS